MYSSMVKHIFTGQFFSDTLALHLLLDVLLKAVTLLFGSGPECKVAQDCEGWFKNN